jgi:DNA-binding LacI/PurR family transcriptional regulator
LVLSNLMENANKNDAEKVRRFVLSRPGEKLPGERELTALFGISRPRIRRLLSDLEMEGLIQRRQGSGTFALGTNPSSPTLETVLLSIDSSLRLNDDPFFSLLIEQFLRTLQAEGIRSVVRRFTEGERQLNQRSEDGIITIGLSSGESLRALVAAGDPPVVALLVPDAPLPTGALFSLLQCDNLGGGRMAAEYLRERGLESLFFVGRSDIPASAERLAGAEQVIRPLRVIEASGLNFAGGQQAAEQFPALHPSERFGIIAANDWLAVGLHVGLTARGISPGQFQIVSFDGLEIAAQPSFGIASLAAPLPEIVEDAIAELRRLARTPAPPGRVLRYSFAWRS